MQVAGIARSVKEGTDDNVVVTITKTGLSQIPIFLILARLEESTTVGKVNGKIWPDQFNYLVLRFFKTKLMKEQVAETIECNSLHP